MNGMRVLFLKESLDKVSEWVCEVIKNFLNKSHSC